MPPSAITLLLVQVALAAIGLRLLARRVWPGLCLGEGGGGGGAAAGDRLITDVWGPIALIAPLVFLSARVDGDLDGVAWAPVGAAICIGVMILCLRGIVPVPGPDAPVGLASLALWAFSGVCLLLVGAAQALSVWVGQLVFALAAVLLWMNTPTPQAAHADPGSMTARSAAGSLLAILAAGGQGIIALLLPPSAVPLAVAIMVAYAVAAGAAAVRLAGPGAVARLAGWSACIGALLGIGTLSLCFLLRRVMDVVGGRGLSPETYVARGFGRFAWEAVLLTLVPVLAVLLPRLPRPLRRLIAVPLGLVVAALVAWRISTIA